MDLDANRSLVVAALARVAAGDKAALQTAYRLTSAKLFAVCLRILGDRNSAEDVLQDVFMTVWRRAGDFDSGRGSPMTWLIAIARNRAIDRLRATRARAIDPLDEANAIVDPAPMADETLISGEEQARLQGCLGELGQDESTALRDAFFNGHTYEVLARRAAVPLGTMKSRMRRALMKLKACLESDAG